MANGSTNGSFRGRRKRSAYLLPRGRNICPKNLFRFAGVLRAYLLNQYWNRKGSLSVLFMTCTLLIRFPADSRAVGIEIPQIGQRRTLNSSRITGFALLCVFNRGGWRLDGWTTGCWPAPATHYDLTQRQTPITKKWSLLNVTELLSRQESLNGSRHPANITMTELT